MKTLELDHPRLSPIHLRKELLTEGFNDRSIARAVQDDTLQRLRRGAYMDASAWKRLDRAGRHAVLARAVLKQANAELILSHSSALPDWEAPVWGFDLSTVHGTRTDRKSGRKEAGVQQHRGRLLPEDIVTRNGVRLCSPPRTMIELTTIAPIELCLVAWCHFLHENLTTLQRVDARYRALGSDHDEPMDHWPDTLTTDLLLRLADGRCEGPGEARTLHLCWRQHLPMPTPQYVIRDRSGNIVARVDFAWPEYGVFLEFDGRIKYTRLLKAGESVTDVVLREKHREQLICELTGWRCIRVVWGDLDLPEHTALRIRNLLVRK